MIETPAAALCPGEFARTADFISLGTNDLAQYTLVISREEPALSDGDPEDHVAVRRLIVRVVQAAKENNKPLILCGELAHHTSRLPWLLRIGIRTLSVAPSLVPAVKACIRSLDRGSYDPSRTSIR
jgi:phosphoenolpyruvate-protein kinase (PTS system EI component)